MPYPDLAEQYRWLTKKCTGVAVRAEFEINVAGGNPVILVVIRPQENLDRLLPASRVESLEIKQ